MFTFNPHAKKQKKCLTQTLTQCGAVTLGQEEESSQESLPISIPAIVTTRKKQKRESVLKSVLKNLSSSDEEKEEEEETTLVHQNESPSPPTVPRSTSSVAAFSAAKINTPAVIKKETKTSDENAGQHTPAKHFVPPDYHLTPS